MNGWIKTPIFSYLFLIASPLISQEADSELAWGFAPKTTDAVTSSPDGYTINYNTVSITEYIRFASKICNTNFIFNEADLNFTVTVVSDAPITPQNVMATLLQVLRIHGFTLLEQDNNLVIHQSSNTVQIATLVTENGQGKNAPIVTRIFRVKNTKPDAIAAIIRPMVSSSSLLEVSMETRQIILTDITANVDKVASLIDILDSPHTPLEIKTFEATHNSSQYLVDLSNQIMTPIAQGSPFILVAQPLANQIFIVSTPELLERALGLLKTLDTPPKKGVIAQKKLGTENMFVYKVQHLSSDELLKHLSAITANLKKTGIPEGDLIDTVETAKPIQETNSITFIGSKDAIAKLKEFLASLDVPGKGGVEKSSFFIYRPHTKTPKEIQVALQEMASNLKGSKGADETLLETIQGAKINNATNTIVFSGEEKNFSQIKDLLATIEGPQEKIAASGSTTAPQSNFFLYKIQGSNFNHMDEGLKNFAKQLEKSGGSDEALIGAIHHMKYIKETNSVLFTGPDASLKKLQELVPSFDSGTQVMAAANQFFIYKPRNQKGEQLTAAIKELTDNFQDDSFSDPAFIRTLQSMKFVKASNSLLFTGDVPSIKKVEDLIAKVDVAGKPETDKNFFLFHPEVTSREKTEGYLKALGENLNKKSDADLIETIRSMKWIEASRSFIFHGSDAAITRLKELLVSFETTAQAVSDKKYFIYKLQHTTVDLIQEDLRNLIKNFKNSGIKDSGVIGVIENIQYVKETNSLLLTGNETALQEVKTIIAGYDTQKPVENPVNGNFFIFHPEHASREKTESYLKTLADSMNKKTEGSLIETIQSMKWIGDSNSFIFHGSDATLGRLKELLTTFDAATQKTAENTSNQNFFLFHPEHASREKTESYLKMLSQSMNKKTEGQLVESIESMKWIEASRSFIFHGSDTTLSRLKELLTTFDTNAPNSSDKKYYIYKVQHTTGDLIEEDLHKLAKTFKNSGVKDHNVVSVIDNIRYVKETNSLLLTGDGAAIEELKTIIAGYDYPRTTEEPAHSNFFMYKPQHLKAAQIQASLKEIGTNLQNAHLADPTLLKAISSAKYVETTNSLIFTGTADALQKIQVLIKDIDIAPQDHAPIQHVGKTTFLLYKLKNAGSSQIINSVKSMVGNLKKAGNSDKEFVNALMSMKYIPETNSLLFTGQEEALTKVQELISQFDVSSMAAKEKVEAPTLSGQPNFFLYKPQALAGPDLQQLLTEFAENLKLSGLSDPDLFSAITSMRWVEATHSLIFTGNTKSLAQVKELLQAFDIPSNLAVSSEAPTDTSIQSIDNTSFLVYKLQFHKGDEIQGALRQIAKDLILSNASVNQNLLNSINLIQWLEVTNSLLCSGDQETLPRLKELIKNLDIPLKQVFIEMLVIETSLTNALNFGLEWGGNYKYKNSFAGSMFNTPPITSATGSNDSFVNYLSQLNPGTSPPPSPVVTGANQGISPPGGFDLGVIGEVIKHNGQTFLTLGSLLTAVQIDGEASIIMTPKIITQDGKTSSIFVGKNVPFAGSFVSNSSQTTVQTTNVEYRDIGLNLTITPVLGNSDIVTLDINLDRSVQVTDVAGNTIATGQNTSISGITTSRTTMQTTVHVPDKNFLILSGFVNNSNTKTKSGIPCLGGLPLIGAAFSKDNDTISNNNIVIFLRPRIITSIDEMRRITSDQEDFFRDQASSPYLEHNYEEAIELIKTVDDE